MNYGQGEHTKLWPQRRGGESITHHSSLIAHRFQHGFTLLELIIVLAIITVLLSIAIPTYQVVIHRARETVLKQNLYLMRRQIEQFAADQGFYPESLQQLVEKGYLKDIPLDPLTDSPETWTEIQEEGSPLSPSGQPGVVDVKSGAEGISTEGTPYSEW